MGYKETLNKSIGRIDEIVEKAMVTGVCDEKKYPLPSWIEISPVDACNRKCEFCPKSDLKLAPDQVQLQMPGSLIEKLAMELESWEYRGGITFGGFGEPLMYKNLVHAIETLSKVARTEIITNGDLLTLENVKDLYQAGLSFFSVSLYDGPEQADIFNKLFEEAGVPSENVFLRDRWYSSDDKFGLKLTNRAGTLDLGQDVVEESNENCPCYYPSYSMTIDWNGDVYLCPQDWNRRVRMGNVALEPIPLVWRSAVYKKYRQKLINGNRSLFPCDKCNCTGTLHGAKHSEIWNEFYTEK